MALNPSALAADDSGHAASIQASGGNKMKLQKGTAVFKDVKITAEEAGEYVLRVASGSRKVRSVAACSALLASAICFITYSQDMLANHKTVRHLAAGRGVHQINDVTAVVPNQLKIISSHFPIGRLTTLQEPL